MLSALISSVRFTLDRWDLIQSFSPVDWMSFKMKAGEGEGENLCYRIYWPCSLYYVLSCPSIWDTLLSDATSPPAAPPSLCPAVINTPNTTAGSVYVTLLGLLMTPDRTQSPGLFALFPCSKCWLVLYHPVDWSVCTHTTCVIQLLSSLFIAAAPVGMRGDWHIRWQHPDRLYKFSSV